MATVHTYMRIPTSFFSHFLTLPSISGFLQHIPWLPILSPLPIMPKKTFFGGFLADIGWSDYGYYGYDMSGATPTIDQLASEGVKLNCVYGGIGCSPGRSQFLTGRYAIRHGIQKGGLNNKQAKGIPVNNTLIAAALSSVGKFSIIVDVIYFFS